MPAQRRRSRSELATDGQDNKGGIRAREEQPDLIDPKDKSHIRRRGRREEQLAESQEEESRGEAAW